MAGSNSIPCKGCGKEVSKFDKKCPHCGKQLKPGPAMWVAAIVVLLIGAVMIFKDVIDIAF